MILYHYSGLLSRGFHHIKSQKSHCVFELFVNLCYFIVNRYIFTRFYAYFTHFAMQYYIICNGIENYHSFLCIIPNKKTGKVGMDNACLGLFIHFYDLYGFCAVVLKVFDAKAIEPFTTHRYGNGGRTGHARGCEDSSFGIFNIHFF